MQDGLDKNKYEGLKKRFRKVADRIGYADWGDDLLHQTLLKRIEEKNSDFNILINPFYAKKDLIRKTTQRGKEFLTSRGVFHGAISQGADPGKYLDLELALSKLSPSGKLLFKQYADGTGPFERAWSLKTDIHYTSSNKGIRAEQEFLRLVGMLRSALCLGDA